MNPDVIVAVIGGLMVLALNYRAFRSQQMDGRKTIRLVLVWAGIFVVMVAAITYLARANII